VNELVALPKPPARASAPEQVVEIVMDPGAEKRGRRRQIGLALAAVALLAAPVWAYEFYQRQATLAREAEAQATRREAALKDASQRQIGALREAVRTLQTKLDDSERRQSQDQARARTAIAALEKRVQETRADSRTVAHQLSEKIGKTADRLQKVETTKIDRTPVGTIARPPARPAAKPPAQVAKAEANPVALVGYAIRDVDGDVALIGVRGELVEVAPGDLLPGAGRVLGIQRRAGLWVVRTEKGEIVGDPAAAPLRERPIHHEYFGIAPDAPFGRRAWGVY
jgi:hypothetical protein